MRMELKPYMLLSDLDQTLQRLSLNPVELELLMQNQNDGRDTH